MSLTCRVLRSLRRIVPFWIGIGAFQIGLATLISPCAWAEDSEPPHWAQGVFCLPGTVGSVTAAITWDDGTGPALYIAGNISEVACLAQVNRIVRWDGQTWSKLSGPNGVGVSDSVEVMAIFDDGSGPALYVGGKFLTAGGVPANRIARWDGHEWTPLIGSSGDGSNGVDGEVRALAVYDDGSGPALYVGGEFANADGISANNIARWDGSDWTPIIVPGGNGVNQRVTAMVVHDDGSGTALYVGGYFSNAGGSAINRIARWNGSVWSRVAQNLIAGMSDAVLTLVVHDDGTGPALYAGGAFLSAGLTLANHVARWNGSFWTPLSGPSGTGVNNIVWSLTSFDDGSGPALYAAGGFYFAGGVRANRIAKWNASGWSPVNGATLGIGPNNQSDTSHARVVIVSDIGPDPALVVGGTFSTSGGLEVSNLALWNAQGWLPIPTDGGAALIGVVNTFSVFDDGSGPALYAAGDFRSSVSQPLDRVARWNGSAWTPLAGPGDTGLNGPAHASIVFDDGSGSALYVGGSFSQAAGVTVNGIARWNGAAWSPLFGPGAPGVGGTTGVKAMAEYNDGTGAALYVGGSFNTAGGELVNSIARWDGFEWSPLNGTSAVGTSGSVAAITVFDDGNGPALYVAGNFGSAGGISANKIARWNGVTWTALHNTGFNNSLFAVTVFDDGTGPNLYV